MKKIWTTDPKKLLEELTGLKERKAAITYCQKGQSNQLIRLKAIEEKRNYHLLVFQKEQDFKTELEPALFFYKPAEYLTRGFPGRPLKDIGQYFSMAAPPEIFEVGMRKFPRVMTPPKSQANFTQMGRTKIIKCAVVDVSLEGAMLAGELPNDLKKGDKIGPITMTLIMGFGSDEFTIQISEATVMNIILLKEERQKKLGIHFKKTDTNQEILEQYIDIRSIEENVE